MTAVNAGLGEFSDCEGVDQEVTSGVARLVQPAQQLVGLPVPSEAECQQATDIQGDSEEYGGADGERDAFRLGRQLGDGCLVTA